MPCRVGVSGVECARVRASAHVCLDLYQQLERLAQLRCPKRDNVDFHVPRGTVNTATTTCTTTSTGTDTTTGTNITTITDTDAIASVKTG